MGNETFARSSSDRNFEVVAEDGSVQLTVAKTGQTGGVAGRLVVQGQDIFADNGTTLVSLFGGGGGGVSDPLTVGPVVIGTGANDQVGRDIVLIGSGAGDYIVMNIQRDPAGPRSIFDASVLGDGAFAEGGIYLDRTVGLATSGKAQMALVTNNATIDANAKDTGDTALTIKGNSAQAGPEFTIFAPGTTTATVQLSGLAAPAAPTTAFVFFARDNGAGKQQACVRFPTGAIQIIATEP